MCLVMSTACTCIQEEVVLSVHTCVERRAKSQSLHSFQRLAVLIVADLHKNVEGILTHVKNVMISADIRLQFLSLRMFKLFYWMCFTGNAPIRVVPCIIVLQPLRRPWNYTCRVK